MAAWTEEEVQLLHDCMLRGYGPTQTSSEFTAKGFSRSISAIRAKKAKEISIAHDEPIKSKDVKVAEALNKEANYALMIAMIIGAMIMGWWFVS